MTSLHPELFTFIAGIVLWHLFGTAKKGTILFAFLAVWATILTIITMGAAVGLVHN